MQRCELREAVFEQFAKSAQAFASPKRFEILDILSQGERDVETLAQRTGLSVANTSRHLQVLKNVRFVASRKEGVRVIYRLADPAVARCLRTLQVLAEERLPGIREALECYLRERDEMQPVPRGELLDRIRQRDAIVLDVRPAEEYATAHIEGAVSIPLTELEDRLREIPHDHEVVAYCRGAYCVLAAEAVSVLRLQGYQAVRLEGGFTEWREAGLPTEETR